MSRSRPKINVYKKYRSNIMKTRSPSIMTQKFVANTRHTSNLNVPTMGIAQTIPVIKKRRKVGGKDRR